MVFSFSFIERHTAPIRPIWKIRDGAVVIAGGAADYDAIWRRAVKYGFTK
jgi:hypothetical protein